MYTAQYHNSPKDFEIYERPSVHQPPHIHHAMECVLVTSGTLELGIAQELFHMDCGDFAIVFPDIIHHSQVFGKRSCRSIHLLVAPEMITGYQSVLLHSCPQNAIISHTSLHPDVCYAMQALLREAFQTKPSATLFQAYSAIILTRTLTGFHLVDKSSIGSGDLIYRTVEYIAQHFQEDISLQSMANALYVSPYALSRVFSVTFHMNFNRYLNTTRLRFVLSQLEYSDTPITEAAFNAGFESQRTFNRFFQETFHMSPRQYRKNYRAGQSLIS